MSGTDKTIQNTFNAFYALKCGKGAKDIDYKLLGALCAAEQESNLMQVMTEIVNNFRPLLEKSDEFQRADWERMLDISNNIYKVHIYEHDIFPIIAEVCEYLDRRETAKNA